MKPTLILSGMLLASVGMALVGTAVMLRQIIKSDTETW